MAASTRTSTWIAVVYVSGVIGISLGIFGAVGIARLAGWDVVISPFIVMLACGVAAGTAP